MRPARCALWLALAWGSGLPAAASADPPPTAAATATSASTSPASRPGLLEVWQAALAHDREYAAAAAAHQAGQARAEQARALWRPAVQLAATVGRAGSETASNGAQFSAPGFGQSDGVHFATSVGSGTSTQWAVTARQPVLSAERSAQSAQLALAAEMADEQWRAAQQALKLRAAGRYFDVTLAAARVQVLQRQADAVTRAAREAEDRFRLGDVPVTDTHEARARLADLQARLMAAQTDLQVSRAALASLTGMAGAGAGAGAAISPVPLPAADIALPPLAPLDRWLADAAADNPGLRLQALQVRVAEHEAARHRAWNAATVDLVAQAGRDRLSGDGDFGAAGNRSSQRLVGVQLTLPLYTGGWRTARRDETAALTTEAAARADQARVDVAQQTRATWLGLAAGASRVQALAQAREASEARREATRLGRQVGHRTLLDELNADNDAAQSELALAQGRIELVLSWLRLAVLAGRLDDAAFQTIDQGWRLATRP